MKQLNSFFTLSGGLLDLAVRSVFSAALSSASSDASLRILPDILSPTSSWLPPADRIARIKGVIVYVVVVQVVVVKQQRAAMLMQLLQLLHRQTHLQ